ncbi:hypothetical protein NIES4102_12610 [Chondrocystis sp. NIES-4102]|nr:hypothetical protein NIES4102_12610 [Chondrocystis sp. NIES-4102]
MDKIVSSKSDLHFEVNQILCLAHQDTCLYGEVIQLLPQRKLCWFRPVCIVTTNYENNQSQDSRQVINVSSGSDLLWPISLFRPALDMEVVEFLAEFNNAHELSTSKIPTQKYLSEFIQQVWQANLDKF